MILQRNPRVIFELILAAACFVAAISFAYQWFSHGMPFLSMADIPGSRERVSVWLVATGVSLAVGIAAGFDLYVYWNSDQE